MARHSSGLSLTATMEARAATMRVKRILTRVERCFVVGIRFVLIVLDQVDGLEVKRAWVMGRSCEDGMSCYIAGVDGLECLGQYRASRTGYLYGLVYWFPCVNGCLNRARDRRSRGPVGMSTGYHAWPNKGHSVTSLLTSRPGFVFEFDGRISDAVLGN